MICPVQASARKAASPSSPHAAPQEKRPATVRTQEASARQPDHLSCLVIAAISLSFVWAGGVTLMMFALAIVYVAQREFYSLARAAEVVPNVGIGVTARAVVIMANALLPEPEARGMVGWAILGSFLALSCHSPQTNVHHGRRRRHYSWIRLRCVGICPDSATPQTARPMTFMGLVVTG